MLVAAGLFSVMGAMVKLASQQYGVSEIVLYRSLIGMISLYAFVRWRRASLATPVAKTHLSRGVVGTAALGALVLCHHPAAARHRDDAQLHVSALSGGVHGRLRPEGRTACRLAPGRGRVRRIRRRRAAAAADVLRRPAGGGAGRTRLGRAVGHRVLVRARTREPRRTGVAHGLLLLAIGHASSVWRAPCSWDSPGTTRRHRAARRHRRDRDAWHNSR